MKFLTKKKIIAGVAVLATFCGGSNYYYETKLKTKDIYLESKRYIISTYKRKISCD